MKTTIAKALALVALTAWYEVRIACTKSRARRWALRCELETRLK
jgi:hypothetical protein